LDYMRERGNDRGHLVVPGSTVELVEERCEISHPLPDPEIERIFADKRGYLEAYRARERTRIQAIRAGWPRGVVDLLPALKARFEPILAMADLTCAGVNSCVLLDCGDERFVVDFVHRK